VQREKDTSQVPYRVQIPIRYTRKTTQSKFYATALVMMLVAVLEG